MRVLFSNLLHDREAVMLYSPTGVGKTWLSLAISLITAGKGSLELLDWQNENCVLNWQVRHLNWTPMIMKPIESWEAYHWKI